MKPKSHYEVLHVQPDAPPEVVHAAYRTLALAHHPDRCGDAAVMQRINAAFAVLADANKRAAYDQTRPARREDVKDALAVRQADYAELLARVALARAQFHRREQLKTIVGVILRVALPVAYLAWVCHEWDTHRSLLGAIGCMFGVYVALRGFLAMVEKLYR